MLRNSHPIGMAFRFFKTCFGAMRRKGVVNMMLAQTQIQRQALSQAQQQSLNILQLPIVSLREYLTDVTLGNPMVDIEGGSDDFLIQQRDFVTWAEDDSGRIFQRHAAPRSENDAQMETPEPDVQETFTEHLLNQLYQDKQLPEEYLPLCRFLVESLNSRGYLDEPIEQLAELQNVPSERMMQALYVIQSLSPAGVGARTLQECLILQLVQTHDFNAYTLKIIKECLPLLAKNSIRSIAKKLGKPEAEALRYCNIIRGLNPIPSCGFPSQDRNCFIIPEAVIRIEDGAPIIHYNRDAMPRICINSEYQKMLQETSDPDLHKYLQKNKQQAVNLQRDLAARENTIVRLLRYTLEIQTDFVMGKRKTPIPMSVNDAALKLGVHSSTVRRAICEKYIVLPNSGTVLLKDLFSIAVGNDTSLNKAIIQEKIRSLIKTEDCALPLSDADIKEALDAMDIHISRRTVAAYREEMGILSTSGRRSRV